MALCRVMWGGVVGSDIGCPQAIRVILGQGYSCDVVCGYLGAILVVRSGAGDFGLGVRRCEWLSGGDWLSVGDSCGFGLGVRRAISCLRAR